MTPSAANRAGRYATPLELRREIRAGRFTGPTAGQAPGYVQTNVVILPAADAVDFAEFCRRNPRPCPVVEQTEPGSPVPRRSAQDADLRSDVPRYRVFRGGLPESIEPENVAGLWRDDLVAFLLGCSFTFESALIAAGLEVRHQTEGCNVPMYRTNVACQPAGKFAGPLVVSMRPFRPEQIEMARQATALFPAMHGAPIHAGDPGALGIANLGRPDFGDAVTVRAGEVPVFWACGVTPQLALAAARPDLAITHSAGCMFVTDLREEDFRCPTP